MSREQLLERGRSLARWGAAATGFGVLALIVAIFSVPFGLFTIYSQKLAWGEIAFVIIVCGFPALAALILLALGIRWLVRGSKTREQAIAVAAAVFPQPLASRIDERRYRAVHRSLMVRGIVYALLAIPSAVFAFVWVAMIGIAVANGLEDTMTYIAAALVVLLGGVIPSIAALLLGWRSYANFRDLIRIRQLVSAITTSEVRGLDDLARAIGLSPQKAETTAAFAAGKGLLTPEAFALLKSGGVPAAAPQAPDPRASLIGRRLNGVYAIEAPLGHGGMGAVFRARDLRNDQLLAIKLLLPGAVESPDALARFEYEASATRALGHPGIVRIHALERAEDGTPYLVMELLEGETLEARLARFGALEWSAARTIALGVGDALAAAHAHGLLHRDLKPANIFLARRAGGECPVLVDFGLAKRVQSESGSRLTTSGVVVGTPLYMSPEQARGEALDQRSDLFGLAVVVYEMVTGVPPFFDKTLAEVYARLMHEAAPLASTRAPGHIPAELDAVLQKALANRREDRFADVPAFLDALSRVPASESWAGFGA